MFNRLRDSLVEQTPVTNFQGFVGSDRAFLLAKAAASGKRLFVIIVDTVKQAEQLLTDIRFFSEDVGGSAVIFPPYHVVPFKPVSYHTHTAAKRLGILYRLSAGEYPPILILPAETLLQKVIPKQALQAYAELVMAGEEMDLDAVIGKLVSGGYQRVGIVEESGDFSLRGGILDIFIPLYPNPVRIELFGDTVDAMRFFSVRSQRKIVDISEAVIVPARETILPPEQLSEVLHRMRVRASEQELPVEAVRAMVDTIREQGMYPGIESLLPLIYDRLDTVFDYLPDQASVIWMNPDDLTDQAEKFQNRVAASHASAVNEQRLCVPVADLLADWDQVLERRELPGHVTFSYQEGPLAGIGSSDDRCSRTDANAPGSIGNTAITQALRLHHDRDALLKPLADWLTQRVSEGMSPLLVCSTLPQAERLRNLLQAYGIDPLPPAQTFEAAMKRAGRTAAVQFCMGRVSSGFVWADAGVALITEDEIFGVKQRRRKADKADARFKFLNLNELEPGDIVVHVDQGLGRYHGLKKLTVERETSDFIEIEYKDGDRLYVPMERMEMVQKYLGVDGYAPVLDKMGGVTWQKAKAKAKAEVEKIAGELLSLYASRKVRNRNAFTHPDHFFRDFEAAFPYEETPDQLTAIDAVLADMTSERPMDRLVCGDVGYGKTEVAIRAAFKAVSDSKQVVVLVPTTILAEQHLQTFKARFAGYPVTVQALSRFRSATAQRQIVADIKAGTVDIVIGTHRVLQKDIAFKDLGLVVIDEEQRFGVKHKEKLKQLRNLVDVLTLSATPIPRTLHMAMTGIRDISVITTPPEQRQAIVSYVSEYDDTLIADALRKELERGGQTFFVHNHIQTIDKTADHLRKLVPEAAFGVAHGSLSERELETVMLGFVNRDIDVLVCTTIIESGLDIPAANTMMINRADRFGLSQIYQLRGRIGRGDEQAYAYLFVPRDVAISKDARKRLNVLMEHTGLGSGFQIAMSDLQIRGAGAALGTSQTGHIAAVGYDMFLKLMDHAIADLKGETVVASLDPEIHVDMAAFIPESFIGEIDQRMQVYRRLSRLGQLKDIAAIKTELIDRYGPLPEEAEHMLLKIMLKVLSVQAGVKRLDLKGNWLVLQFSERHQKNPLGIMNLLADSPDRFQLTRENQMKVRLDANVFMKNILQTKTVLKEIAGHVNN
ncbi:MAG: transcription-repair coupling factor [Deltaproteobacteria bacterium]|nr:MAG: transcription-repair coupling factor [Deltaproteobacteria bacterium]